VKVFITTIGTLILAATIWVLTTTMYQYNEQSDKMRWVADQAAAAGALYLDEAAAQEGMNAFVDAESLQAIKNVVCSNLHLDNNANPDTGAYVQRHVVVTAYLLDDQNCRVYRDGVLIDSYNFSYPYLLTVADTGYSHAVGHPSVVVTIDAGTRHIGGGFLQFDPVLKRSGAYEWMDK
jgi:hypothetical protein